MSKQSETKKRLLEIETEINLAQKEMELKTVKSNDKRARSITVGTAFSGVTEVTMRGDGEDRLWCLLQPVEVIELIHQLAASNGCHILVKPRNDFASWRVWRAENPDEQLFWTGHAPQPNALTPHQHVGTNLPPIEQQSGTNLKRSNENVMATKKTVNRRGIKRASKTS